MRCALSEARLRLTLLLPRDVLVEHRAALHALRVGAQRAVQLAELCHQLVDLGEDAPRVAAQRACEDAGTEVQTHGPAEASSFSAALCQPDCVLSAALLAQPLRRNGLLVAATSLTQHANSLSRDEAARLRVRQG